MSDTWIVILNPSRTNIGSGDKPASLYEPDFEKKFFAFDTFDEAKTKAFELIKSYASSENSMFDGEGGIKKWKEYLDNEYEGNDYGSEDEDEDVETEYITLPELYDEMRKWFCGETIDLSGKEESDDSFFQYDIELVDGKKITIKNYNRLLYGWIIKTDMINITGPGNYSLYIRDNFDWDNDDPSILQVDIAKAE